MSARKIIMAAVLLAAGSALAVQVGDVAPDFTAIATSDKPIKLSDFKGSWVILFFYPKSFTPGCTKEACSFRDSYGSFQKSSAVVLGASVDTLDTQKSFKAKNSLPFELLCDSEKNIARAYDALALGGLFAQRKTFLINPGGRIAAILDHVNPLSHDAEVLSTLRRLQSK